MVRIPLKPLRVRNTRSIGIEMAGLQFIVVRFEDFKDLMYATLIPECYKVKNRCMWLSIEIDRDV